LPMMKFTCPTVSPQQLSNQPNSQPTNQHFMYHNKTEITNNTVSKK